MVAIVLGTIFLLVYISVPIRTKIVLFIINLFLPDPIPYIDELIMAGNIVLNLIKAIKIIEFVNEHKVLSAVLGITSVFLLLYVI